MTTEKSHHPWRDDAFPTQLHFDLLAASSQRRLDLMIFGIGKYLTTTLPMQTIAIPRAPLGISNFMFVVRERKWFSQNL